MNFWVALRERVKQKVFGRGLFIKPLHIYFRVWRGMTIGVRAIVRSHKGEFLLLRHTYTTGWHFPGGGVEVGQTTERALANELTQETGLCVTGEPQLHGIFFNNGVSAHDHVVVYLCEAEGELPTKPPSLEIAELRYFALNHLPRDLDHGTLRRIEEVAYGKTISREW